MPNLMDGGKKRKSPKKSGKKRKPSAYNKYVSKRMKELMKQHPEKKVTEFMSIIGKEWSKMTDAEKKKHA